MIVVTELLGRSDEARYAGRRVERFPVTWAEASRRKLRRMTDAGTDVAVDLPAGSYLADGAVLADDGERVVTACRTPERAVRVRFDAALPRAALVEHVALVARAFANQHVPVEAVDGELRIPVTTSDGVALDTVLGLHLAGVEASVEDLPLGRRRPLSAGHAHG